MKMKLMDGVRLHKAHPKTFHVPSRKEKCRLGVGDYVKIGVLSPTGDRLPDQMEETLDDVDAKIGGRLEIGRGEEKKPRFSGERLWFHVVKKEGRIFTGVCHNYPLIVPMKYGDEVQFESRHVLDLIYKH